MKKEDVTKIWSSIGVILFLFSLDVFLRTTSMTSTLSALAIDTDKVGSYSIAIFGILFGVPMLTTLLYLTCYYVDHWPGFTWRERLPKAFNINIEVVDPLGRKYQLVFLLAFLFLPMLGQIRFFIKMIEGTVYEGVTAHTNGLLDHFRFVSPRRALVTDFRHEVIGGVTYYPFYEPWLFLLCEIALLIYFYRTLRLLFKKTWPARGLLTKAPLTKKEEV